MKIAEKMKVKKQTTKKKLIAKPKKEQILIVAQEIKFARLLAGNEKKTRDRALKTLKKWLHNCFAKGYEFKEGDFTRIWKGLFYAVWMSDKPLVQEELCESIAGILDQFPAERLADALLLVKVGFRVLATEWYGIDHHRMDKCLMLVRRYLRGSLRCLLRCEWSLPSCQAYAAMLAGADGILAPKTPLYARNASSMVLHIIDCFLEELSKVSSGAIPEDSMAELLRPFCSYMCGGQSSAAWCASRRLLTSLLRHSAAGQRYEHRRRAWQQMGCPAGGPDALELVSDEEESEEEGEQASDDDGEDGATERALDPRAGRVDVELSALPVPHAQLCATLRALLPAAAAHAQRRARLCLARFEQLSRDEYPLRVAEAELPAARTPAPRPTRAARRLRTLERRLAAASDDLALRGLGRKHRKRLLAKSRAGLSIVDDAQRLGCVQRVKDCWQIDDTEPQSKKNKQGDTSNKENENKGKNNKNKKRKAEKQNDAIAGKKSKKDVAAKEKDSKNNTVTEKATKVSDKVTKVSDKVKVNDKVTKVNDKVTKVNEKVSKVNVTKVNDKVIKVSEKVTKVSDQGTTVCEKSTKIGVKATNCDNGKPKNSKKQKNKITNASEVKEVKKPVKNTPKIITDTPTHETHKLKTVKTHKVEVEKKKTPSLIVNKVKKFQKQTTDRSPEKGYDTPKKVKFVLKNNSMQGAVDYYKSVRQSPNIPYDSGKMPSKTNLKVCTPSPINPFFKKKLRLRK